VAFLAPVVGGRIGVEIKFEMTIGGKRMVPSRYTAIRNPATGDVAKVVNATV
jgi:hypothetical protein